MGMGTRRIDWYYLRMRYKKYLCFAVVVVQWEYGKWTNAASTTSNAGTTDGGAAWSDGATDGGSTWNNRTADDWATWNDWTTGDDDSDVDGARNGGVDGDIFGNANGTAGKSDAGKEA